MRELPPTSPMPWSSSAPPATWPTRRSSPRCRAWCGAGDSGRAGHRRRQEPAGTSTASRRGRARASRRMRRRRPGGLRQAAVACSATSTATTRTRRPSTRLRKRAGSAQRPLHYLAIPPSLFGDRGRAARPVRLREGGPGHRREAVRPRPGLGAGAQPLAHCSLPRVRPSSASTITSGKEPVQNLVYLPLRQLASSSRSGTATTSRACRSPWPRTSASRGAAAFYDEAGAIRDVVAEPPAAGGRQPGHGTAAAGDDPETIRDEKVKVLKARPAASPRDVVRGQFRGYRRGARRRRRFAGRDLRRRAAAHRHLALGGRAVLHPRRQVPAGDLHRGGRASSSARRRSFGETVRPPNYFRFRLEPDVAIALGATSRRPGERIAGEEVELQVAHTRGWTTSPYEQLLGDAMAGSLPSPARTTSKRRGASWIRPLMPPHLSSSTRPEPGDRAEHKAWCLGAGLSREARRH